MSANIKKKKKNVPVTLKTSAGHILPSATCLKLLIWMGLDTEVQQGAAALGRAVGSHR